MGRGQRTLAGARRRRASGVGVENKSVRRGFCLWPRPDGGGEGDGVVELEAARAKSLLAHREPIANSRQRSPTCLGPSQPSIFPAVCTPQTWPSNTPLVCNTLSYAKLQVLYTDT